MSINEQGPGAAWARFEQAVTPTLREQVSTSQRPIEVKREVNALLAAAGQPARYASVETPSTAAPDCHP